MLNKSWQSKFFTLWTGQAFSVISSSVVQMSLIWYLTAKTGSALVLSMASLVGYLPNALLGLAAGTFVDRTSKKKVIIGADLFIAGVSLILTAVVWITDLPTWLILLVLALRSVGTAFHTPAISALTPAIVPQDKLTKAAGYTQSLQTFGYMAGAGIAGALFPIWSLNQLIFLDVIGALIATAAVLLVDVPTLQKRSASAVNMHFWKEMKDGYSALKKIRSIYVLVLIASVFAVLYLPIDALFPLMSLGYFKGTTLQASWAEISFSAGMLLGSLILGIFGGLKNRGLLLQLSFILIGGSIAIAGLLPRNGLLVFVVLCSVMGFAAPFYNGTVTALIQEKVPEEYLGRVFGFYGSLVSLAMPLGLLASGFFADRLGVNHWFILSGVLILGIFIFCMLHPSVREIESSQQK